MISAIGMECDKCKEDLPPGSDSVVCGVCSSTYHYNCSVREAKWRNMTAEQKAKWACGTCKINPKVSGASSVSSGLSDVGRDEVSVRELLLSMNSRLDKLDEVKQTVDAITKSISFLSGKYDDLLREVREYREASKETSKIITQMKDHCKKKDDELGVLTRRLNALEQYGRGNNLEIHGLSDDNSVGYENWELVVQQTARAIGVSYNVTEIQAAHRIPSRRSRNSKQPDVFLIQFVSKATKEEWLRMGRKKRLSSKDIVGIGENRVFFNENLTPYYKKLFYDTKVLAKEKRYEFVWVFHGRIRVKKNKDTRETIVIADHQDLKLIV